LGKGISLREKGVGHYRRKTADREREQKLLQKGVIRLPLKRKEKQSRDWRTRGGEERKPIRNNFKKKPGGKKKGDERTS